MTNYPVELVPLDNSFFPELNRSEPVINKAEGKLILQISRTNCAGAIWRIHDAINKYTSHTCRTITASDTTNGRKFQHDVFLHQVHEVKHLIGKADVIHFHNWVDHESPEMAPFKHLLKDKYKVLQYHTEPSLLQKAHKRDVVNRDDIRTLVIAQKHVRFYPKSTPVPNMIDIYDPRLVPIPTKHQKLKVIYTPSDLKSYAIYSNTCCGKGYSGVNAILKKLQAEGLIEYTLITDKRWEELMPIKQQHDVCIDECVTGGYHLCSLEALSQGLVTIGWIDDQTKDAIRQIVGYDTTLPWVNTQQHELEATLRRLAADPELVEKLKISGRSWMENNWNPNRLVQHFTNVYEQVTTGQSAIIPPVKEKTYYRSWGNNRLTQPYLVPEKINPAVLELFGQWKDQKVVIWGNGPTVTEALGKYTDAKHIGTNAAAKLKIPFDVYCIGDKRFLEVPEKKEIAMTAPGLRIYNSVVRPFMPAHIEASYIKTIGHEGFCSDLTRGIFHGYSIVWFAMQVAVWAGAKDILLAGCGHDYTPQQPRFYKETKVSDIDQNFPKIVRNYRHLIPFLGTLGIRIRTIGKSRLSEAGVPQIV
jgi:hypothetical protein